MSIYQVGLEKVLENKAEMVSFSFKASRDFGKWAADFHREVRIRNYRGEWVDSMVPVVLLKFDQRLRSERSPFSEKWDGKNAEGQKAPAGKYQLVILAWNSALDKGDAAARTSSLPDTIDW